LGVSDSEILAAGLGSTSRTGNVIDRFRDRLMMPIYHGEQLHGFIGRRNPDHDDAGPKYLNTPETVLFRKGDQLFGLTESSQALAAGATPVLVEGFVDAIAVTLAAAGAAVGVAPLGTAFTDTQADQLRPYIGDGKPGVIVACDGDLAGHKAAIRAYWQLTARGDNPRHLVMAAGLDPAALLQTRGTAALRETLTHAISLADVVIADRINRYADRLETAEGHVLAVRAAAQVIGALPPDQWLTHIDDLSNQLHPAPGVAHLAVVDAGHAFITDPLAAAATRLAEPVTTHPSQPLANARTATHDPTSGGSAAEHRPAAERWAPLGRDIDSRIVDDQHWPALAAALDRAAAAGYNAQTHLPRLAAQPPLPTAHPARALHYRLVDECEAAVTPVSTQIRLADNRSAAARATARNAAEATRRQPLPRPENATPGTQQPEPRHVDHTRPTVKSEDSRNRKPPPGRPR
jgi:DNA primase